jgi:hypothetical protein
MSTPENPVPEKTPEEKNYHSPGHVECPECEGEGKVHFSCCGDDIKGNDTDLCPTCLEHCGDDGEDCDLCEGTGEVSAEVAAQYDKKYIPKREFPDEDYYKEI